MVQLQTDLKEIQATGTQVVGVSYDKVATLKSFSDARKIGYRLLSDEGSLTIKAYGIQHARGYSLPGTYLIDKEGIVRAELFLEGYRERHANSELIAAAKKIQTAAKK